MCIRDRLSPERSSLSGVSFSSQAMPAPAAKLRYPHGRVLLQRTKLAYVHLRNLIGDAKRDRTARVAGYVAIWLPDEFLLLFLRDGEVVNCLLYTSDAADERSSV